MTGRDPIDEAFDPERFRALGHALIDELAAYLASLSSPGEVIARPPAGPEEVLERFDEGKLEHGGDDPLALLRDVIAGAHHLHHRRSFGHQMPGALPTAALTELVSSLLNNSAAVFEMGPVATAVETRVVRWMCAALGYGAEAGGVITSGGSLGNLAALLAMRAVAQVDRPAILVSDQAHYCIQRAAQILGWGDDALVEVGTDDAFRLCPELLPDAGAEARRRGLHPIGVVASTCSTATGAIDPLRAIARFCAAEGLWMHVDGAHGASLAVSARHRELLDGIELADSVVWDAHKLLLMPALVTGVLFRDGTQVGSGAIVREASYLFVGGSGGVDLDLGRRTIECTKPAMALRLYAALRVHGTAMFAEYVSACVEIAARFADLLEDEDDFELAVRPEANIVCFRFAPDGSEDLDTLQVRARQALLRSGEFYVTQAELRGGTWLRCTLLNPKTELGDLRALLVAVRDLSTR